MKKEKISVPTFVKWAGGKTQLLEQFSHLLPDKIETYLEPFLGGGAVYFYLKKKGLIKKSILSDNNKELIHTYKVIKNKPKKLIKLLIGLRDNHSEKQFYEVRQIDPTECDKEYLAARFIYLNKTCFNGLYRVNSKGIFNTPLGSYKDPSIFSEETIMEASKLLKDAELKIEDFRECEKNAKKNDFIYFDPPYYPINKTSSFTKYTKNGFLENEQIELRNLFVNLHSKGCNVMLSNSDTPFINKIFKEKGFKPQKVFASRMINCNGNKRGKISEIVVKNYEKKRA